MIKYLAAMKSGNNLLYITQSTDGLIYLTAMKNFAEVHDTKSDAYNFALKFGQKVGNIYVRDRIHIIGEEFYADSSLSVKS